MWETSSYRQKMCDPFFNLSFAWEDCSILPNFFHFFLQNITSSFHPNFHAKGPKPTPFWPPKGPPHFQGRPTAQTPARLWYFDLGASEGLRRAPGRLKMLKLQQKSAQQEGS